MTSDVSIRRLAWQRVFFLILIILARGVADLLLRAGLLYHPVENEVILISHAVEEVLEELSEVTDVGFLFKFESSAVV